jgi:hypothetical protein
LALALQLAAILPWRHQTTELYCLILNGRNRSDKNLLTVSAAHSVKTSRAAHPI